MGAPPPPSLPKLPIFYIIQTLAFYYFVFGRFSTFITRFVTSGFLVKPTIDHWWRIFMLMKGQIKIGYTYSSSSFLAAKTTYEKWKRAKKNWNTLWLANFRFHFVEASSQEAKQFVRPPVGQIGSKIPVFKAHSSQCTLPSPQTLDAD